MATTPDRRGRPVRGAARASGPVRVGRIEFVNCFPLYHHFERELAARGVAATIVEGYPAALNEMLVSGAIDVALPSSIAFARDAAELALLPQVSISSFGAVDSVQLFTRVPLQRRAAHRPHREERHLDLPAQGPLPGVGPRARVRAAPRVAGRGPRRLRRPAAHRRRGAVRAARRGLPVPLRPRRGVAAASPACRWSSPSAPCGASSRPRGRRRPPPSARPCWPRATTAPRTRPRRPPPRRSATTSASATSWSTSTSSSSASRRSTAPA